MLLPIDKVPRKWRKIGIFLHFLPKPSYSSLLYSIKPRKMDNVNNAMLDHLMHRVVADGAQF